MTRIIEWESRKKSQNFNLSDNPKHTSVKPKNLRIDSENLCVNLMVPSRDPEERETAQDVMDWIKDVRTTGEKDNSLHPAVVTKFMRVTAIRQGKWGWSVGLGGGFRRILEGNEDSF